MCFSVIAQSLTTFSSNHIQKPSHLSLYCCLYHFLYNQLSVYNLLVRKYLIITASWQPFICLSLNLVRIPRSSSCSSSFSHLALSIPIFSLLVILYIGALSFIRLSILNLLSSFCSCHIIILTLNSSMVSFSSRLASKSLNSYFLILVLNFRLQTPYPLLTRVTIRSPNSYFQNSRPLLIRISLN